MSRFVLYEDEQGRLRSTWPDEALWSSLQATNSDPEWKADLGVRLEAYFRGDLVEFPDVPTPEGSEFHHRCWEACRRIPRGEVRSYRQLAEMAGSGVGASRAAGQAMRHNHLPVIIPCHRVISSSGTLHGFSGSSDPQGETLRLKQWLLRLEGYRLRPEELSLFGNDPEGIPTPAHQSP